MKKTEKKIEEKDPKENFYRLVEKNHYLGEEKTILITNDYDKLLKKFIKIFINNVDEVTTPKTYSFESYFLTGYGDDLDGISSWEDFFKIGDQSPEIIEYEDTFYVEICNEDENVKEISEYELLKEIYNNDRKSLEKIPFCMDGN
jgi:hypothetical protein